MDFIPAPLRRHVDVNSTAPCWIWTGAKDPRGTPRINKKYYGTSMARQFIHTLAGGEHTKKGELISTCRRKECVNPNHLTYEWPKWMVGEDFWNQVEKTEGCWLWKGCVDKLGYGRLNKDKFGEMLAHRFAYKERNPDCQEGVELRHSCTNKNCVNPTHLSTGFLGEWNKANNYDTLAQGKMHNQKMNKEKALDIRKRIMAGVRTKDLVVELGCSKVCIADLKKGRTWNLPECFPPGWV